jgi:hypothetical protein
MKIFSSKLDYTAYIAIVMLTLMGLWFASIGLLPYFRHSSHVSYYEFLRQQTNEKVVIYAVFCPIMFAVVLWYSYWNRIKELHITDSGILVARNRKPTTIQFADIANIATIPAADIRFSTYEDSTWSRSLVGFTGKYYNKKMGYMQWYCTKSKNYVAATLKDGNKVVFTPDEPDEFVQEVNSHIG